MDSISGHVSPLCLSASQQSSAKPDGEPTHGMLLLVQAGASLLDLVLEIACGKDCSSADASYILISRRHSLHAEFSKVILQLTQHLFLQLATRHAASYQQSQLIDM
jgi:hypothetical protein